MASPPSPAGGHSRFGALSGSDLLLILILVLLSMRLIGIFAGTMMGPFDQQADPSGNRLLAFVMLLLAIQNALMIGAVYWVVVRRRGFRWDDLGLRPAPRGSTSRAVGLALLALPVTFAVEVLVQRLLGGTPVNPQIGIVAPAGFSWFGLVGMLILVGVLAPFAEELLFRGLLYRWLRERWGVFRAVAVSSLGFAMLHGIPHLIPVIALLGVMLAVIYEHSGSLWPSVVAHGLYNSITVILLYAAIAHSVPPG